MSIVINASQTYAQSTNVIRVEVPFAFSANDKTLPAGTYTINPATNNQVMWKIQSAYQNPAAFLMAKPLSRSEGRGNVRLIFHRYGNRNFLAGFVTNSYQVELPTSSSEKNVQRSSEKNLAGNLKSDVVTVAALPKK